MSDVNISTPTTRATRGRLGGPWIDDWRPENGAFWDTIGKAVARRNLIYSVFSEHIGFSIWSVWRWCSFLARSTASIRFRSSC